MVYVFFSNFDKIDISLQQLAAVLLSPYFRMHAHLHPHLALNLYRENRSHIRLAIWQISSCNPSEIMEVMLVHR